MTDKQKVFCEYYIQSWNATQAARQAGYKGNDDTIRAIASENLTKPNIKEYIESRVSEIAMDTNEILSRLTMWGRGTVSPFLKQDDYSQALCVDSENQHIGLIKKIKQKETTLKARDDETVLSRDFEIELHDAKDAVIQLAKIRGMYTERIDHTTGGEKIQGSPIIAHNPKGEKPSEL